MSERTITIIDTFLGEEKERIFTKEEYVKQWTQSIGVGQLWYLTRTDHYEEDQPKVDKVRELVKELAENRFEELFNKEEKK